MKPVRLKNHSAPSNNLKPPIQHHPPSLSKLLLQPGLLQGLVLLAPGLTASCEGALKLAEAHKASILLCVALLHHPAPGHGRSAQTPVLSGQNHILNLSYISHFIELLQEFLCWVIHLCTWFGHTFETKQASQG